MESEATPDQQRRFNRNLLRTWPVIFKLIQMTLCVLCFFVNELTWYPFVAFPARTFLSVVACVSFIVTLLLFLVIGFGIDDNYTHTNWWRILVVAQPALCSFFFMAASAAQLDLGGRVDAGFRAAATFGFLAFTVYGIDAIDQWRRQREAGELPALPLPAAVASAIGKPQPKGGSATVTTKKGNKTDHPHQELPAGWTVPDEDDSDGWSQRSGHHGTSATYTLNS